jgi:hypothetical protein
VPIEEEEEEEEEEDLCTVMIKYLAEFLSE